MKGPARSAPISMPTSMVVVLNSIGAARPALSAAVVLHARNADRAADARRALPKAEAVVVGDVEASGTARPPHRNPRRDFRRAAADGGTTPEMALIEWRVQ